MTGYSAARFAAYMLCLLLVFLPPATAAVNCSDVTSSPVVDFRYDVVPAESAPIMVNFYSTSEGGRNSKGGIADPVDTYTWRFGDGETSEQKNPLHTYAMSSARYEAADKPFAVSLTVRTACGHANSTSKEVPVYCLDQRAGFTIVQPVGEGPYAAPVAVNLQDTSLHVPEWVTSYHYTLWDAGMTRLFKESTEKDPTFVITNGGRYVIRQEVFKACSNPPLNATEMAMTIQVTGSAASDAIPMETIPFTTTATGTPATTVPAATTLPAPPVPASLPATASPQLPEEAPPGTGTLSVVTSPDGARVLVNDVQVGTSPVTVPGFTPGTYNLRLEKSGYRTKTVHFEIADGRRTEYSTVLEPDSGGPGLLLVLGAVIIVAAGAGAAYWFVKKKKPKKPAPVDWNKPV